MSNSAINYTFTNMLHNLHMKNKIHFTIAVGILIAGLISCKKDPDTSLGIAITSDDVYHQNVSVNVKEIWLNYATKKSKSEWIKLDIQSGVYDLADLYPDQKDTVILGPTIIEDIQTLLQLRVTFGTQGNSIITQTEDTLAMTLSNVALSGVKVSLNKGVDAGKRYDLRLAIKADSTAIHEIQPVFDPVIRLDSLNIKP